LLSPSNMTPLPENKKKLKRNTLTQKKATPLYWVWQASLSKLQITN